MCTMTWRRGPQGRREIFFNRDEKKTRTRAVPPEVQTAENGLRFLAPRDPDGGGTWMMVNEKRLCVALLNRWHETGHVGTKTRGGLVTGLAGCGSAEEVRQAVADLAVADFSPFTLVVLDDTCARAWGWDGRQFFEENAECPLISSSYRFHDVKAARVQAFEASKAFEAYHESAGEVPSAFTVRMNRPDAQTWSRSIVTIEQSGVAWNYWEEMPDLVAAPLLWESRL